MTCVTKECLERILQVMQYNDSMTNSQHECNAHPEIVKTALTNPCEDFKELHNEIGKAESNMRKACDCKYLLKVL